jgi:glycerophosphoryl diester phosphodiesterase
MTRYLITPLALLAWTLSASLLSAAEPAQSPRPLIVAHRGLLRHAPENTLANFRACLELRLGFELDVERSRDGHLVCIHDSTVNRTTNGRGRVGEMTLAAIKKLDAGSWFDPAFVGERIPTIDEVFALIAGYPQARVLIAVDLKVADNNVERDTVKLAVKHKILDRLLFIGRTIGNAEVRNRLRAADDKTQIARVANNVEEFPASLADKVANWVYVRYVPSPDDVERVHAAGKRVFIAGATVAGHQPDNWKKVTAAKVDAVLTDFPLELRQTGKSRESSD